MTVKELIALLERVEDKEMEVACGLAHGRSAGIRRVTIETGKTAPGEVWRRGR